MIDITYRVDEDGKPQIGKLKREAITAFHKEQAGKYVVMKLEKKKKKRSNQQNAYYWGVCIPIIQTGLTDAGYEGMNKDKTHDMLKLLFLRDIVDGDGEPIAVIKETKELTTTEFADYIAELQQWASEFLNVYIPDPNEWDSEK